MIGDNKYMVGVRCTTYQHSKYITDALNGFTMQKTDFPFLVMVIDDASTDGTQEVITSYLNENFELHEDGFAWRTDTDDAIMVFARHKNNPNCHVLSLNLKVNLWKNRAKKDSLLGDYLDSYKYTAFCEGDDYWTDPNKLQRQVDFLESHPEYKFCCHRFNIYNQESGLYQSEYAIKYYGETEDLVITTELFLKTWVTQMLTTIMRTDVYAATAQEAIRKYESTRDIFIFYELLCHGNGISLNANMGIYRWQPGGISIGQDWKTRYQVQYSNLKKIFDCHPNDANLRNKVFYQWNHLLRFSNIWDKQAWITYAAFRSHISVTQRIAALVNFFVPAKISTFASDLYQKKLISATNVSI